MCCPSLLFLNNGSCDQYYYVLTAAAERDRNRGRGAAADYGGCREGMNKRVYCTCSPTQHARSFRCRQHHHEYQWGAPTTAKARDSVKA